MKKILNKRILRIISLIVSIFLLYICGNKLLAGKSEIVFLNVGQGDASLIKLNNKTILIDGGPDNLVIRELGKYLPFYQRRLDYIILSHYHDDHITGLIEIIKRYQVGEIIYMKGSPSSNLLNTLLSAAKQKKIKVLALENSIKINLAAHCSLGLLNPLILNIKADPNNSLVTKLDCPPLSALFSGDNNFMVEAALLKTGQDWSAKVFKASHHGSKTANSEKFLKAIQPSLVVISVGALNKFGHPSPEILERLKKLKIHIKRTDKDGAVKILGP